MIGISAGPLTVHHASVSSATAGVVRTVVITTTRKRLTVVDIAVRALISLIPSANLPCQVLQVLAHYWYL